jgi:hypothetical protein
MACLLIGVEAYGRYDGLLHNDARRQASGAHGGRRELDALHQQRDGCQQEERDDGDAGEQVNVVQRPLRSGDQSVSGCRTRGRT